MLTEMFDYCISNPPYQLSTAKREGHTDNTVDIFPQFQEYALAVASHSSFVYPYARWWVRESSLKELFKTAGRLTRIDSYSGKEAEGVFPAAGITDGIAIVHNGNENSRETFWSDSTGNALISSAEFQEVMPSTVAAHQTIKKILTSGCRTLAERGEVSGSTINMSGGELAELKPIPVPADYSPKGKEKKVYANASSSKGQKSQYYIVETDLFEPSGRWKACVGQSIVENENRALRLFKLDPLTEYGRSLVSLASFETEEEVDLFLKYAETSFFESLFRASIAGRRVGHFIPDLKDYTSNNPLFKADEELGEQHEYYGLSLDKRLRRAFG